MQGSFRPGFHVWLTICCWSPWWSRSGHQLHPQGTPAPQAAIVPAQRLPQGTCHCRSQSGGFSFKSSYLLKKLRTFWGGDVPILWKRKLFPLWLRPLYQCGVVCIVGRWRTPESGSFTSSVSPPLCAGIETNLWSRSPLARSYEGTEGQAGFRQSDKLKVARPLTKSSILGCGGGRTQSPGRRFACFRQLILLTELDQIWSN